MINRLNIRLKNCLQTIIELEPDFQELRMCGEFEIELGTIKAYLNKIEDLDLAEEDVIRLEHATANLLDELRRPFDLLGKNTCKHRILQ